MNEAVTTPVADDAGREIAFDRRGDDAGSRPPQRGRQQTGATPQPAQRRSPRQPAAGDPGVSVDANEVTLTGTVARRSSRCVITPAGLPVVRVQLGTVLEQIEAGHEAARWNAGNVWRSAHGGSWRSDAAERGDRIGVQGFLNRKNRMSTQLVLHANRDRISIGE